MSGKPRLSPKQKKDIKNSICEILEKSPIVESACQKVGITRMMFYRWKKEDETFSQKVDESLKISRASLCDLAESKMIQLIGEGHPSMIRFCLRHNSPQYQKNPDVNQQFHFNSSEWGADHIQAMMKALPEISKTIPPKKK